MKSILRLLFLLFILSLTLIYQNNIKEFILDNIIYGKSPYEYVDNKYAIPYEFNYVSLTNDYRAKNKQQILDIFYTYLNSGSSEFYFYCDYPECKNDISKMTTDNTFTNINNFVAPFNTYNRLNIAISNWGKIEITLEKAYTNNEITLVSEKMDEIVSHIITDDMTDTEKIKTFHDYIINNTKYDQEYITNNLSDLTNNSHRATGALLYNKALCGGYAHSMSLFLNMLNLPNYRVSSENHIWNLVYLDGKWYHVDLTWDDPMTTNDRDLLLDNYLLINNKKLKSFNTGYHDFDETVYSEASTIY